MSGLLYNGSSVVVWVDGACLQNNSTYGNRKAGFGIWFNDKHSWNQFGPLRGASPTNNNAEIDAGIQAIKACLSRGLTDVEIRSDSNLLVQGAKTWINDWKRSNWRKSDGGEVENKQKFKELDQAMTSARSSGMRITWTKVPGHSTEKGNIQADRLAQMGAAEY